MKLNIVIYCALCVFGCHKEACPVPTPPSIYGNWETLPTVGFLFQYEIFQPGKVCATLADIPTYQRCWDIQQRGDTVFFAGAEPRTWVWKFEADNIAIIQELTNSQTFVLRRL